jgi:hypothetical protein
MDESNEGEEARLGPSPGVTRMRSPTSGFEITKPKMRAPSSVPLTTSELAALDAYNERAPMTMKQLARMFVKYCWWKTLAPLVLSQRRLNARRVRLVKELFDLQYGVDDIIAVEVETTGDETPLEPPEPGETRLHVQWHGTAAAELVRSAPWPWHQRMSPERRWFEALYQLVPAAYRTQFCSKPLADQTRQKINLPTGEGERTTLKQALLNAKYREQWVEFLAQADEDRSLLRTGAESVPWPFHVRQLEHIVQEDSQGWEMMHEQYAPQRWPGPEPGTPLPVPALKVVASEENGIVFEGWFTPLMVPPPPSKEKEEAEEFPRRFAEGQDNKDMQEFWACFLLPLMCSFAEEYIV